MKKIMLAVVASLLMFSASVNAQPYKYIGREAPSVERIAQKRSEQQAKFMCLNKTQRDKLYLLNLKAAKSMQKQMQKSRKEADKYNAALLKIVGADNMRKYEANRMRDRRELQRGPKDSKSAMGKCPMVPNCQKPHDKKDFNYCPKSNHGCPKAACCGMPQGRGPKCHKGGRR